MGIFRTDAQRQCIYTNPRYQAICGCIFEEALDNGWMQCQRYLTRFLPQSPWGAARVWGYRSAIKLLWKDMASS